MILVPFFLAFLLPCIGMSTVILVYIFLIWWSSSSSATQDGLRESEGGKTTGLSDLELKKLPCSVACKELKEMEMECVVCLEGIEVGQMVRMLPDCHHGFHLQCADAWLSKHPVCPICRHELRFGEEKLSAENIV